MPKTPGVFLRKIWNATDGLGVPEYCLLTALIAILGLGIVYYTGGIRMPWEGERATVSAPHTAKNRAVRPVASGAPAAGQQGGNPSSGP